LIARARIVAQADPRGGTRLPVLRSSVPLVLRAGHEGVWIVGGAAGPLGGDDLSLEIEVHAGAELTIRSAAASVVLPGPQGRASRFVVSADVEPGGTLRWLPEPVVAAAGCLHRADARVVVARGARLVWREEIVLGRYGEEPGSCWSRVRIDIGDLPLVRQEVRVGADAPGWAGSAVSSGARALGSLVLVDPAWEGHAPPAIVLGPMATAVGLAGPAAQVTALAPDAPRLRELLTGGEGALRPALVG
jgi:urease accessory protein